MKRNGMKVKITVLKAGGVSNNRGTAQGAPEDHAGGTAHFKRKK